jgi:hypothetical protein
MSNAPIHHLAICNTCKEEYDAVDAAKWAHKHAEENGHNVELQLAYYIKAGDQEKFLDELCGKAEKQ